MRTALITLVAITAAACGILLTPGAFATAESDGAVATIGLLQAQGYDVDIGEDRRGRDRFVEVVVNRTITVSLDCSSR